jgi:hypothetical protein
MRRDHRAVAGSRGAEAVAHLAPVGDGLIGRVETDPARRRSCPGRFMSHDFSIVLLAYLIEGTCLTAAFAAAAALARRAGSAGEGPALWAICAIGLLGYAGLFAFLPGRGFGAVSGAATALAVLAAAAAGRRHMRARDLALPALSLSAGLLYLAVAHLGTASFAGDLQASLSFERTMPYDDRIPLLFAEAVYHHLPTRTGPDPYGWYFTDRPPLQAGFVLAFSWLWRGLDPELAYRALGTLLQAFSVGAAWLLCRCLGFGRGETRLATLAYATSGFAYYESVYAWPKLLAAAYLLVACAALGGPLLERRRARLAEALLFAAALGLALLSHGAVAFAVIPLLALVAGSRLLGARSLAAAAVVLGLYAPWAAYTHFVDPNPGRLIRMHLTDADVDGLDPLPEVLWRSYAGLTPEAWLSARADNVAALVGDPDLDALAGRLLAGIRDARQQVPLVDGPDTWALTPSKLRYDLLSLGTVLRVDQVIHVMRALGLLNLAWPLGLVLLARRGGGGLGRGWVALALLTALSAATFVVLEFKGGDAVTVHGSYSIVVGLFLLAAVLAHRVWRRGAWWLFGVNAGLTVLLWVVFSPGAVLEPVRRVQPGPLAVGLAALAALVWLVGRCTGPARPDALERGATTF